MPSPKYGPVRAGRAAPSWILPNSAARSIARRALERRETLAKSRRGGLSKADAAKAGITSGVERAESIARGDYQPAEDLWAFFARFKGTYQDSLHKAWEASRVQQAWDLWGGTPMWEQAAKELGKSTASS